jgi:diguanylate cyclase (GGDEF)-like protein/PAS domain S-box-containing protein
MRLLHKLILGFLLVAFLSLITGYFADNVINNVSANATESFVSESDAEELFITEGRIKKEVLTASITVTIIGIIIGFIISASISERLRKLNNAVLKIALGDLDTEIEVDSHDEIGQLAGSFREMTDSLKTTTVSREKLNREIEEHKRTEGKLFQARQDCEDTFNTIDDMITVHDRDFNLIRVNKAAQEKLGLGSRDATKEKCFKFFHGSDEPPAECPGRACMETGETAAYELYEPHLKKNIEIRAIPRIDSNDRVIGFIHITRDMTRRKQADEKLRRHTFYDQLTNLPNRELFSQYMEHMLGRTSSNDEYLFAVLFIDLDRFKVINDSLGHLMGDHLLVAVARRLESCLRNEDMISRFGGDEFVLFLENIADVNEATYIADRIQKKLAESFNLNTNEVFISASIGIALSSAGYISVEESLRDAGAAMYRAKALGRARYEIFDAEMHANAVNLLQVEADLRRAVQNEEFVVYYQPIVSVTENSIIGVEALVRWNHPERGLISPLEFIPIAEETGLITEIGEWVLRTSCMQNKVWLDAGYRPLHIRVNFSARQFQRQDLQETIIKVLNETEMPPELLNIEVTESIAMEEHSIETLNKLAAMGIQISIDDFGTGYSSLGYLRELPINTVKIDKSFIRDILVDPNAKSIVRAIIAMANNLRIMVVAEGVETEDQKAFLHSQQCDKIQGFFYSPPVPEKNFTEMLEKENALLIS